MFARTERLLLRPGWAEDAPALAAAIGEEAIVRNLATAPWPYRLSDAEAFLAVERGPTAPNVLIFRRTQGAPRLIGGIALRERRGAHELGYWISRPHWGLGYATEAGRAVIHFAREALGLRRIEAGHFLDNPASGRILEKLGFRASETLVRRYSCGRRGTAPYRPFTLDLAPGEADQMPELTCQARIAA